MHVDCGKWLSRCVCVCVCVRGGPTAVGTVGELLGQVCMGSLLGTSQMEEETGLNSDQLC